MNDEVVCKTKAKRHKGKERKMSDGNGNLHWFMTCDLEDEVYDVSDGRVFNQDM